ncbi:MAG: trehalose-binding protein [Proteobacteria bacterium]|nr:trehalose-binding protein [Pseudomonadota bacterium]
MNIGPYTFEDFLDLVASFHGNAAPGVVIGGIMVEAARSRLPERILFDALAETRACLPDAVQLLTPCTIGNGWLKVIDLGRFALSLYDKYTGDGVRVFLDPARVKDWPEINNWYLKLKPKQEQDKDLLLDQIKAAGRNLLGLKAVKFRPQFLGKRRRGKVTLCPLCREGYPAQDGGICRACQGDSPFLDIQNPGETVQACIPALQAASLDQALGRKVLHDVTQIIPGESKGPVFRKGQTITVGDICRLQQMGRRHLYLEDENQPGPEWVHENDAAVAFAEAMSGEGIVFDVLPREGKVNLSAVRDGLFTVEKSRLQAFNCVPGVMCASRHGNTVVVQGRVVAGTRAIPLFLPQKNFDKAMTVLADGPLFRVLPLKPAGVGILVTGDEIFLGLVEDRFIPIIRNKVEKLGCEVVKFLIVPDDRRAISAGVQELLAAGSDLIVTTAGLSVDPDDVTRSGLIDAGATDILYGAPILPGAMTLIGRIGSARIIGVPACALYFKRTSFDLILPRILAGVPIYRGDLADFGHGAMCLECKTCAFPKCPFGR